MINFLFLADFSVIKPDFGLLFWTSIIFLLFWIMMSKFAFKPITSALKKRENDIQHALDEAKRAKEEMSAMQAQNEELLVQAREERAMILKEAKEAKTSIISEAKTKAKVEANKIVSNAMQEIENQKNAAMAELKTQVGTMALNIAEKVIQKELKGDKEQERLVNSLVDDIKLN